MSRVATEGERSASFKTMPAGTRGRRPAPVVRPSAQRRRRDGGLPVGRSPSRPALPKTRRARNSNGPRQRRSPLRYLLVIPALAVTLLGVSFAGAALSPGNASLEAKWADWLRANHAGWLAQHFEEIYYSLKAPPKGGTPKGLNKVPGTVAVQLPSSTSASTAMRSPTSAGTTSPGTTVATPKATSPATALQSTSTSRARAAGAPAPATKSEAPSTRPSSPGTSTPPSSSSATSATASSGTSLSGTTSATSFSGTTSGTSSSGTAQARALPVATSPSSQPLPPPRPVPLVVKPALPGEGEWKPTGPLVNGVPAMYVAQFRADDVYTSEITSAVWMDPRLLRFELVPGSTEPGGTWSHPPYVTDAELPYLVAAFNGGFRFQDAKGGIYLEGKVGVPLLQGAASFVIYKNGTVNIGAWGSQVTMTPEVSSVLQNAVLLVDNGQIAPSATYTDNAVWGYTLGGGYVVPRSGIGVTADGALVYVAGPALTAKSLAESLQRAGAVRAMTLDINPEWVTFNFYLHQPGHPLDVTGVKLYPEMQRSADRYLPPVWEARDFYEVLLPGAPISG